MAKRRELKPVGDDYFNGDPLPAGSWLGPDYCSRDIDAAKYELCKARSRWSEDMIALLYDNQRYDQLINRPQP